MRPLPLQLLIDRTCTAGSRGLLMKSIGAALRPDVFKYPLFALIK